MTPAPTPAVKGARSPVPHTTWRSCTTAWASTSARWNAAQQACASDDIVVSSWGLYELAEAASRCGRPDIARDAALRLSERTTASGTPMGDGCRRPVARPRRGRGHGRGAVPAGDRLADPDSDGWYLARARLSYGEWLRRQGRRIDAREQLRAAHRTFMDMGARGSPSAPGSNSLATGGTVRKRLVETRDELTTQERQIAQLARDGLSNPEIGSRLFLSPRTVSSGASGGGSGQCGSQFPARPDAEFGEDQQYDG